MSTLPSLLISLLASSCIGTLSYYGLTLPLLHSALASILVFIAIFILLSNQLSSSTSQQSNLNRKTNKANAVYDELTGTGTGSSSGSGGIAAAKKKKNKVQKVVSSKTSELNAAVSNTVNQLKGQVNDVLPTSANSHTASVEVGTGGEPASKKKKKKSKKSGGTQQSNISTVAAAANDDVDDDDDGTLDIAHHPSLSGGISGGKGGKKSAGLPIISKPAASQQPKQNKSESEAAVAKREAQAKLKEQAEIKAKIALEAEKRQQQIDAAEGWTQTTTSASRKKDENQQQSVSSHQQQQNDQSESTRNEIKVESRHQALIIGPKGKHIQDIQQGTGARIQMPSRDSANNQIVITGTSQQVQYATAMINSLISKGYSSLTHPNTVHDDISIPDSKLGIVIGQGGSNIKIIQSKTQTRINLPERGTTGKTIIVGPKDGVKAARVALKQLINDGFCTITHEGYIREEVEFPVDKHAYLIGPKGQTIKSIQGNTNTKIHLPASNNPNKNVIVIGPEDGVKQAIREIKRVLIPRESTSIVNGDDEEKEYEEELEVDEDAQQYTYTAPSTQANAWTIAPKAENEDELWQ